MDINEFIHMDLSGIKREEPKDPTLTFIGGLVIGLVLGGMIGAAVMGHHVLTLLN